jgi:hypothetical protein
MSCINPYPYGSLSQTNHPIVRDQPNPPVAQVARPLGHLGSNEKRELASEEQPIDQQAGGPAAMHNGQRATDNGRREAAKVVV